MFVILRKNKKRKPPPAGNCCFRQKGGRRFPLFWLDMEINCRMSDIHMAQINTSVNFLS